MTVKTKQEYSKIIDKLVATANSFVMIGNSEAANTYFQKALQIQQKHLVPVVEEESVIDYESLRTVYEATARMKAGEEESARRETDRRKAKEEAAKQPSRETYREYVKRSLKDTLNRIEDQKASDALNDATSIWNRRGQRWRNKTW